MKKMRRRIGFLLPLMLLFLLTGQAFAGLKSVGPTDPVSTLPKYYLDTNNLALEVCLDQNGMCLLPGGPPPFTPNFDPAFTPLVPITTNGPINDGNFPDESFYYSAAALLPIEGGELANLAFVVEAAFLSGVVPDGGITFLRTDLQKMRNLVPNSTYRVTHPYGTFTFTTDAIGDTTGGGGVAIRLEDGPAVPVQWLPPGMKAATNTGIGPFLVPASGIFPTATVNGEVHTYVGDGTPVPIAGSPTGNNFYRIERLDAVGVPVPNAVWETNQFALNGRIFTGPIPSELSFTATYARNETTGQVDIFAAAQPGAVLTLSGTGIFPTPLVPNIPEIGKYFLHIPLGSSILPTGLVMTNSLDLQSTPPHPVTLVDEIMISQSLYNPTSRELMITASSRDKVAPPVLSVTGFAGSTLDAAGKVVLTLPTGAIPPTTVQVVSSYGGFATAPVSVVMPPPPPVANDDTAVTAKNAPVSINVLVNDTAEGVLNPATVTIDSAPASGATAIATASGSVTYTPTADFAGTETFTYTVKDGFGQLSNTAIVTVTVHEPPVAGNDSASAAIGTTVAIDVIANDSATSSSINSTTVNIVSPASCGTTAVLPNGTVNFTAPAEVPAGDGTCTFSYVVSDTFTPPALSTVAIVTVTVTPPPAPVAADDSATTLTNSVAVVNVIVNDTSAVSTINPATVAVTAPTGGTATANLNGTITYTPPATPGIYTFTYTVKDNAASPLTSNVATVTVTVDQGPLPPLAADDPASPLSITMNSSTIIDLVANDTPSAPATIDQATVAIATYPANGTVTVHANGSATYAPAKGYVGTDSFTYTVKDSTGLQSNAATVALTITAPAPVANNDTVAVQANMSKQINVIGNDTVEAPVLINPASIVVSTPTDGTAVANADGTITYTAPALPGTYTFTYTVDNNAAQPLSSNSATVTVTVYAAVASVSVTPTLSSPQVPNTPITFIASGTGGSGNYEYRFWLNSGTGHAVVQEYSSASSWTWTPVDTGTYDVLVDVRNAGSTEVRDALTNVFQYKIATPATSVELVEGLPSPQPAGTPITFTATASGGSGPYEYRFWVNEGNGYAVAQNYSTTNTFTWSPTKVGYYDIMVDTRVVNAAAFRDALVTKLAYQIAPAPATAVTLTPSVASPQLPGSSITFTAEASGGAGPYEYRFWINSGGTFLIAQDYTTINTFTWTPFVAGNYDIMVDTRAVGSTNFREALAVNSFYQIKYAPAAGVTPFVDKASPQPVNAPIVVSAAGSGGSGAYEYRFWLNSGSGYTIVQDYSTLSTWTWFPVATGNFDMLIDVRNAGTASDRDASTNVFFYQIQ